MCASIAAGTSAIDEPKSPIGACFIAMGSHTEMVHLVYLYAQIEFTSLPQVYIFISSRPGNSIYLLAC